MAALSSYKRIVIKIGSSLLVDEKTGHINQNWLKSLAEDIAQATQQGQEILIVSSGAIALGRSRLGLGNKPLTLAQKQACAAAGQALLTRTYEQALSPHGLVTAQALLTLNDTEDRRRWINAKETLATLLDLGAIIIINENDTVATDEIRYGDNDRLAARVSQMVGADLLILFSDVDGLYDKDPHAHSHAKFIDTITELSPQIMAMGKGASRGRNLGSGGMETKLQAAKIAMDGGCTMVITKGSRPHPLKALAQAGAVKSSWFHAKTNPQTARKQWIAASLSPKGMITIDPGASAALGRGKSLLAAGVVAVEGDFAKGDAVQIITAQGQEIGRGLAAYSARDSVRIKGLKSEDIIDVLGYDGGAAFIHRDNMVLAT